MRRYFLMALAAAALTAAVVCATVALADTIGGGGYNGIQEVVHNGSALTQTGDLCFEGATADDFEACFAPTDPTADRTITLQDVSGTVYVSSGTDVALADGGTNASLTAVNGGVCYSSASALALTAAAASSVLVTDGSSVPSLSTTLPAVSIGNLTATNANGPYIEGAASSATNPTLVPNQASPTAGIGGTGGDVSIITSGAERINVDTAGTITLAGTAVANQAVTCIDNNGAGGGCAVQLGTGNDTRLAFFSNQTPDMAGIGFDTASRGVIVSELGELATDLAHANPSHPTIWIHTVNATATEYTSYQAAGTQTELFKALTDGVATSIIRIPIAAEAGVGGELVYTVYATDGSTPQTRMGHIIFTAVNDGGTETCVLGTAEELDNTPTGTLTASVTCDTSPANAIDLQLNAASSLVETTLRAYYHVTVTGPGAPLPQ